MTSTGTIWTFASINIPPTHSTAIGGGVAIFFFSFLSKWPVLAKLQTAVRDEAAQGAEEEVYFESRVVHYSAARRG